MAARELLLGCLVRRGAPGRRRQERPAHAGRPRRQPAGGPAARDGRAARARPARGRPRPGAAVGQPHPAGRCRSTRVASPSSRPTSPPSTSPAGRPPASRTRHGAGSSRPSRPRAAPARTWRFSIKGQGVAFLINGKQFDPNRIDTIPRPRLGTTERWVLLNKSSEWHPIHIHQDDYRVVSVNRKRVMVRSDQDVVPLPPAAQRRSTVGWSSTCRSRTTRDAA